MTAKTELATYSRRSVIAASGVSLLLMPKASARSHPLLKLPASVVFLRMNEDGAVIPDELDRRIWSQFSLNLGALISRIEPIPHNNLLPGGALETGAGQGSAILSARLAAQNQGYDYLLVYGVVSKSEGVKYRTKKTANPALKLSRHIKSKLPFWDWDYAQESYVETRASHLDIMGEAHLLDLKGGAPLASTWAERPKRNTLARWTSKDTRDDEIVLNLADAMQRKIQELSMQNFESQKSISQRF